MGAAFRLTAPAGAGFSIERPAAEPEAGSGAGG
jgi:hypothetical protein